MKYNSLLFIPANKERYLHNDKIHQADAIIIDFEDSIISKDIRTNICIINSIIKDISEPNIFIRIRQERYNEIIENINLDKVKGIMIPKFCLNGDNIRILEDIEEIKKETLILIEDPKGLLDLEKTLVNYSVNGVCFGSEDYISELNAIRNKENLFYPRASIVNITKAYKIKCYDTIFPYLNSDISFKEEVDTAYSMGFDGKMAIHPSQLEYINKRFKPDLDTINKYKKIIDLFYKNKKINSTNVMTLDGEIIEPPHIKRYENIVKEFQKYGDGDNE
ncbi:HpcH/HpaI aldolase/citrate lyase family protein [Alkaliphilus peptidifermentans DSM 18978]|uniref:HpcH/HpaI aldolase/citrate lyase family protein n=2 Tax=Alkaliphilus TaxID=114627 RepID=A0A1G5JEA8_9FIRM|nr:HpcH/HpaI aldolase/citrate lyase family protein [Alkaliphilus peptidifermentans DSM 18978]